LKYDAGDRNALTETIIGTPYRTHGAVAVITLDNPPVNGLGHEVRTELVAGIDRALNDAAVSAIVLIGAGKLFSGGADIREFNTPKAMAEPTLRTVIRIAWAGAWSLRSAVISGSYRPEPRLPCPR